MRCFFLLLLFQNSLLLLLLFVAISLSLIHLCRQMIQSKSYAHGKTVVFDMTRDYINLLERCMVVANHTQKKQQHTQSLRSRYSHSRCVSAFTKNKLWNNWKMRLNKRQCFGLSVCVFGNRFYLLLLFECSFFFSVNKCEKKVKLVKHLHSMQMFCDLTTTFLSLFQLLAGQRLRSFVVVFSSMFHFSLFLLVLKAIQFLRFD